MTGINHQITKKKCLFCIETPMEKCHFSAVITLKKCQMMGIIFLENVQVEHRGADDAEAEN